MKHLENGCVDCGLPCLGGSCPLRHIEYHTCDRCGAELSEYEWREDGEELCLDCQCEEEEDAD